MSDVENDVNVIAMLGHGNVRVSNLCANRIHYEIKVKRCCERPNDCAFMLGKQNLHHIFIGTARGLSDMAYK